MSTLSRARQGTLHRSLWMCSLFGSLARILDDFPKLSILMMGREDFVLSELLLSFCRQPLCWSLLIGTGTHWSKNGGREFMKKACDGSTEQQYEAAKVKGLQYIEFVNLWCVCALLVASQPMLASFAGFSASRRSPSMQPWIFLRAIWICELAVGIQRRTERRSTFHGDSTDSTYSVVSSSCFRTRIESVPHASKTAHHNMVIPVPCWCRTRPLQKNHHLPTSRSMSLLRSFRPGTCRVILHSGPMLKSITILRYWWSLHLFGRAFRRSWWTPMASQDIKRQTQHYLQLSLVLTAQVFFVSCRWDC